MSYCTNCGNEIADNAKFCSNCGMAANKSSDVTTKRQTVYEGNIHKCPNCGEVLPALAISCPLCGYEIRGNKAASSVKEMYKELKKAKSAHQKDTMIRNFPIPNSKEDILEFMIMASSNILGEEDKSIYEAWLAKFEQAYQKSTVLFKDDEDFLKIRQIYDNCQINIASEKRRKLSKLTKLAIARNIMVGIGIISMIAAAAVDAGGGNSSLLHLVAGIIMIASASSLVKKDAAAIDYIVCAAGGGLIIALAFLLKNHSWGQLSGGITLIIVAVNYFKSIGKN